jgi:hypothetical protein
MSRTHAEFLASSDSSAAWLYVVMPTGEYVEFFRSMRIWSQQQIKEVPTGAKFVWVSLKNAKAKRFYEETLQLTGEARETLKKLGDGNIEDGLHALLHYSRCVTCGEEREGWGCPGFCVNGFSFRPLTFVLQTG